MEWIKTFEKVGHWELDEKFKTNKSLSQLKLPGINFIADSPYRKLKNVVYLFKTPKEVFYIGETSAGVESRFSSYRYGFDKLEDTDNRVKIEISNLLLKGEHIEIYLFHPIAKYMFNEDEIQIPISRSLEEYLITKYQPKINIKQTSL